MCVVRNRGVGLERDASRPSSNPGNRWAPSGRVKRPADVSGRRVPLGSCSTGAATRGSKERTKVGPDLVGNLHVLEGAQPGSRKVAGPPRSRRALRRPDGRRRHCRVRVAHAAEDIRAQVDGSGHPAPDPPRPLRPWTRMVPRGSACVTCSVRHAAANLLQRQGRPPYGSRPVWIIGVLPRCRRATRRPRPRVVRKRAPPQSECPSVTSLNLLRSRRPACDGRGVISACGRANASQGGCLLHLPRLATLLAVAV
jgi:hypothetical protein